jgi:alpha-methylacyl-CoA racemase
VRRPQNTEARIARVDPLSGVRVVELARLIPGDVAGQALAELGADVIKVEGPPLGDYLRHIPPILGEMSALHAASNRNKRSIAIDHRSEAGRDLIYRLIRTADVVLEVSDPGSMAKYKLDYESIRLVNPKVVYCSVTGFGQTGPYAHLPSHGANMECLAGTMTLEDTPEGPRLGPRWVFVPHCLRRPEPARVATSTRVAGTRASPSTVWSQPLRSTA